MFYSLPYEAIDLGPIPQDQQTTSAESLETVAPRERQAVRWLRPLAVQPTRLTFWQWVRTPRLRRQLLTPGRAHLLTLPAEVSFRVRVLGALRLWVFGLNTTWSRDATCVSFPLFQNAELVDYERRIEPLPDARLGETTRCGVHRAFPWRTYRHSFVPRLKVEPIQEASA